MLVRAAAVVTEPGQAAIRPATIVIEGNMVTDILTGTDHPIDDAVNPPMLDLGAATIIPGLIDAHVHLPWGWTSEDDSARLALRAARAVRTSLAAGITTVRDVASPPEVGVAIRDAIGHGELIGSTVLTSTQAIRATGGHGTARPAFSIEVTGEVEARRAVRRVMSDGADLVKINLNSRAGFVEMTNAEVGAIIDEAHHAGLRVACHATNRDAVEVAIRGGADTIEHGPDISRRQLEVMCDRGITYVPTLVMFRRWALSQTDADVIPDAYRRHEESVRNALDIGVRVAMGSDMGWVEDYGFTMLLDEIERLVELGRPPMDAIRAATINAAYALGRAHDLGQIRPGSRADLVAFARDPTTEIDAIRAPIMVMAGGKITHSPRLG